MKWSSQQPKHGDRIIHCGHIACSKHHFFKVQDGPLRFARPDGTHGEADWIVCCDPCFIAAGGNIRKVDIKGDGQWQGDEPAVYTRETQ